MKSFRALTPPDLPYVVPILEKESSLRAWQTIRLSRPREALTLTNTAPEPTAGPGQVRLSVLAAGIGRPDALMCRGDYAFSPSLPFTQGQEVVGRILDWGEGVEGRRVGDRVVAVTSFFTGNGGFAEECLVLDDFCLDAPEDLDDARAAGFLIPFHTALLALERRGRLETDETLLVLGGAGGTGSAAIAVGRALGAHVIATAGGDEKADFCRSLGADRVIDHRTEDIAEAVMAETKGRGANVVFDPVGGAAFTSASHCVAPEGRILAIGFASGSWGRVDTAHLVDHNYSVLGVIPTGYDRASRERAQARLLDWWRTGRLDLPATGLVPFEALPSALERLLAGNVQGKLSLAVGTSRSRLDRAGKPEPAPDQADGPGTRTQETKVGRLRARPPGPL